MKLFSPRLLWLGTEEDIRREFLEIGVNPADAAQCAATARSRLIRLSDVPVRLAAQLRQEMRALGGEALYPSSTTAATDLILIGSPEKFLLLCERLSALPGRPDALARELALLLRNLERPPDFLVGRNCKLSLHQPLIMGILNVTPDSFSDGGRYRSLENALQRGLELASQGADIVDVGGESTRPGAAGVSAQEELDRVVPVIEALRREVDIPLSIDTSKAVVAREAVAAGAEFINDVSGLQFDPDMATVAAASGTGLFLMHTRGRPGQMQKDTQYADLLGEVLQYLGQSIAEAVAAGIPLEKIAVDPGIGFAKDLDGNLELLRRLPELRSLGRPILLGTSRKGFIGRIVGREEPGERLAGTLATIALGVAGGAGIFRVHDVGPARDAAYVASAICRGNLLKDQC